MMPIHRVTLPTFHTALGQVGQALCPVCGEVTVIGEGLDVPQYCDHTRYAWFVPGTNHAMFAFEEQERCR